jgi:hypothetical protein
MGRRGFGTMASRVAGGLAIVAGSFYATLKIMDYFDRGPPLITIEQATYGANCGGAKPVNATQRVARVCDGRTSCNMLISAPELGDPAPGCGKEFSVRYRCSQERSARGLKVGAEASGSKLYVDCQSPS